MISLSFSLERQKNTYFFKAPKNLKKNPYTPTPQHSNQIKTLSHKSKSHVMCLVSVRMHLHYFNGTIISNQDLLQKSWMLLRNSFSLILGRQIAFHLANLEVGRLFASLPFSLGLMLELLSCR